MGCSSTPCYFKQTPSIELTRIFLELTHARESLSVRINVHPDIHVTLETFLTKFYLLLLSNGFVTLRYI